MTKKYVHLGFDERIEIEKLLLHKTTYTDIALALKRNKSTIQREIIKQSKTTHKALEGERLAVGSVSNRRSGKNKINQCRDLQEILWQSWGYDGRPGK